MSETIKIAALFIGCVFTDNIVFSRYLGENPAFAGPERIRASARLGAGVALVAAITSIAASALYYFVLIPLGIEFLKTVLFALLAALALWASGRVFRGERWGARFPAALHGLIAVISVALGLALFGIQSAEGFLHGALTGVFGGAGFFLAVVVMAGVRARVALSDVPQCLRGLPIGLISAGLISLAFMGFSGFFRSMTG